MIPKQGNPVHRGNETGRERHAPPRRRAIHQRELADPAVGRSRAITAVRRCVLAPVWRARTRVPTRPIGDTANVG
jgi:hypothetical protein